MDTFPIDAVSGGIFTSLPHTFVTTPDLTVCTIQDGTERVRGDEDSKHAEGQKVFADDDALSAFKLLDRRWCEVGY